MPQKRKKGSVERGLEGLSEGWGVEEIPNILTVLGQAIMSGRTPTPDDVWRDLANLYKVARAGSEQEYEKAFATEDPNEKIGRFILGSIPFGHQTIGKGAEKVREGDVAGGVTQALASYLGPDLLVRGSREALRGSRGTAFGREAGLVDDLTKEADAIVQKYGDADLSYTRDHPSRQPGFVPEREVDDLGTKAIEAGGDAGWETQRGGVGEGEYINITEKLKKELDDAVHEKLPPEVINERRVAYNKAKIAEQKEKLSDKSTTGAKRPKYDVNKLKLRDVQARLKQLEASTGTDVEFEKALLQQREKQLSPRARGESPRQTRDKAAAKEEPEDVLPEGLDAAGVPEWATTHTQDLIDQGFIPTATREFPTYKAVDFYDPTVKRTRRVVIKNQGASGAPGAGSPQGAAAPTGAGPRVRTGPRAQGGGGAPQGPGGGGVPPGGGGGGPRVGGGAGAPAGGGGQAARVRRNKPSLARTMMRNILGPMRTLQSSGELSAPLRQGIRTMYTHPVRGAQAFGDMFRATSSDSGLAAVDMEAMNRLANAGIDPDKIGLAVTDTGLHQTFGQDFLRNLPGIKHAERGYEGYMKSIRSRRGVDIIDPSSTIKEQVRQADLIGDQTGYGRLGGYRRQAFGRPDFGWVEKGAEDLADVMYSPRYFTSRVHQLNPMNLVPGMSRYGGLKSPAYQEHMKDTAKLVGGVGGSLYAGDQAELFDVEWDPRSMQFLKPKFGDTTVDVTGGLGSLAARSSQILTGQAAREGEVKDQGRWYSTGRLGRSLLAPAPSLALDLALGKDFNNEETNKPMDAWDFLPDPVEEGLESVPYGSRALESVSPMWWHDVADTTRHSTLPPAGQAAVGAAGFFGASGRTDTPDRPRKQSSKKKGKPKKAAKKGTVRF